MVVECESALVEQINNLESNLRFKTEEVVPAEEKREIMEERLKRVIKQNREHAKTNMDLCWTYDIFRIKND